MKSTRNLSHSVNNQSNEETDRNYDCKMASIGGLCLVDLADTFATQKKLKGAPHGPFSAKN
jgi:hypothetical protein